MKAIVHIGSPKAGSSSIQDFLYLNRDALARRGVRFHRNVKGRGSQFEYGLAALDRAGALLRNEETRVRYRARDLAEQHKSCARYAKELSVFARRWSEPVAIFSSEHLLPWLHEERLVRELDAMFSDAFDEVRYVVYFRDPADLILSQYSERIKRGSTLMLKEFIDQRHKALDPGKPALLWRDVVGADRLDVRLLTRDFLKDGDLIADFCHACGIERDGLIAPPRANEALNAVGAECLRMLNLRIPELLPTGGHNPLRKDLLEAIAELSAGGPELRLNKWQRNRIDAVTRPGVERLRQTFFADRETLFPRSAAGKAPADMRRIRKLALALMTELLIQLRLERIPRLSKTQKLRAHVLPPQPDDTEPHKPEAAATGKTTEAANEPVS